MAPPAPKANRSLQRGLQLLDHLAQSGALGLADLTRAAALPKPTIYRLLNTLAGSGWVYRRRNDGRYVAVIGPQALATAARTAQLALPHLAALTARTGLAADLTWLIEPGILEVIDSTRRRKAGGVDPQVAGFRPSLAFSAPGRALLAASSEAERARHLQHLLRTDSPAERHAATSGQLAAEIARTQKRGYGIRAQGYWPQSSDYGREPMDIAVALVAGSKVLGCVSLVWPSEDAAPEAVARGHLSDLKLAVRNIVASLGKAGNRVTKTL
ncbi:helix-turn-helix domain-containing protein [Dongia sp.]|uniref:helix-turn-helix domain-containing protein n=1 Tax=Dongia sp. TaxID=1977262 RepID=UPI0035B42C85